MNLTKNIMILLSVTLIIFACRDSVNVYDESRNPEYRLAAYNSLTENEKSNVTSDWENATVTPGVYASSQHGSPAILAEGYPSPITYITPLSRTFAEGTPLVMVTFNTIDDGLLGPIVIVLLAEDATVIGFFGRI